jgi:beta-N-acetylhexosaminidase
MVSMPRPPRLSRRRFLALGGATLLAAACGEDETPEAPAASPQPTRVLTPGATSTTSPAPTATPNGSASLDEKIGQMLMLGFRGYSLGPGDPTYERVHAGSLGNVVLFDYDGPSSGKEPRNIQSPQQVRELNATLQTAAPGTLLIAADQEGKYVARLSPKYGFPSTYSEQELGERNDLAFTREAAAAMGATLKEAGINLNLAPVVDVNVNPDNPVIGYYERSFSADPDAVTRQALAFIEGHHQAGVLTTLKHFPGHGSSKDDSHDGFVDVTDLWSEEELIPFRDVIAAGKADAVMTAHIFNARLDATYPATLSKATITGILRERLAFDGVVITDDMLMGAIAQHYGFEAAIELAIDAGSDILAVSNNLSYDIGLAERTFLAVRDAVLAGRISERRIDESYQRIMALKSRLS